MASDIACWPRNGAMAHGWLNVVLGGCAEEMAMISCLAFVLLAHKLQISLMNSVGSLVDAVRETLLISCLTLSLSSHVSKLIY